MGFDQALRDRTLTELGRLIVAGPDYAGHDWRGIAVVIQIEPRKRLFGYMYLSDGSWTAAIPEPRPAIEKALALAEAMRVEGKAGWKTCLIQISAPDGRMKVDFEYDNPARWDVTPANLEERVEALRPD